MFWGIVSHKMNAEVKNFLVSLPCVFVFMWWMEALLPYCIGWVAVCTWLSNATVLAPPWKISCRLLSSNAC